MKERLIRFVIKRRRWIILVFLAAAGIAVVMQAGVRVNYRMADYLPADAPSTIALDTMQREFSTSAPNARVLLEGVTVQETLGYKAKLAAIDGVSDVFWLDDAVDIHEPLEMNDTETVETYYKNGDAVISLTVLQSQEKRVIAEIYQVIGDRGAVSGEAAGSATYQSLSVREATRAALFLVPAVILILTLSTTSWLEPLLFLFSIGIAVLLNMGTGLIFPSVSYITNAISPILQLAVSLDYAIFLLGSFDKFRSQTGDLEEAMRLAMRESFSAVLASALTTLFGFLALTFMRFRLGADLGINLAKGILFSLVGALVFLPALTLESVKYLDKARHRRLIPQLSGAGSALRAGRFPVVILALLLVVPSFLAQSRNSFTYGTGDLDRMSRAGKDEQRIIDTFGQSTPIVVLVPRGEAAKEVGLANAFKKLPHIRSVLSYATAVGVEIPPDFLDSGIVSQFYSAHYSRLILYADTHSEGDVAFDAVEKVRALAAEYYGADALVLGQSVSLYDIKSVITADDALVNGLAIAAIGLVLLLTLRSLLLPVLLVLTIEMAIWFNLATPYFTNTTLNYVGFLVISTVQLGATVDYAILFTEHYLRNRKKFLPHDASMRTVADTVGSILTSGSILSFAGLMLGLASTNQIVKELGILVCRGALFSLTMVLFFLPAALSLCDGLIRRTTLGGAEFLKKERVIHEIHP